MGVDGIETDLRLTADGALILHHDHLAPDGRAICEIAHAELNRLAGFEVPTAVGAVEQFPHVLWNLEIKVPAALEPALELIARFGTSRQFLVTSFWHNVVDLAASRCDVECGLLVAHRPRQLRADNPRVRNMVWYYETMDAEMLEQGRRQGLRNYVYGVVTPAEHARCLELGLDGVITDRPEFCPAGLRKTV
jgi:glycerophosphoryl diester phosphodiesterase